MDLSFWSYMESNNYFQSAFYELGTMPKSPPPFFPYPRSSDLSKNTVLTLKCLDPI